MSMIDPILLQRPTTHGTTSAVVEKKRGDLEELSNKIKEAEKMIEPCNLKNIPGVPNVLGTVATKISFFALQTCVYFFYSSEKSSTCDCNYSTFMGIPCVHKINDNNFKNKSLEISDFHPRWHIIQSDSRVDSIRKSASASRTTEESQDGEEEEMKLKTQIYEQIKQMKAEEKEEILNNLKKLTTGTHILKPIIQQQKQPTTFTNYNNNNNNPNANPSQSQNLNNNVSQKRRGRPKGSKNKKTSSSSLVCKGLSEVDYLRAIKKRGRGRPRKIIHHQHTIHHQDTNPQPLGKIDTENLETSNAIRNGGSSSEWSWSYLSDYSGCY